MLDSMLLKKKAAGAVNTKLLMHFDGDLVDQVGHTGVANVGTSYLSNQKFGKKAITFTASGYTGYPPTITNFNDLTCPGDFTIEAVVSYSTATTEQMLLSCGPGVYIDFYTGSGYNGGQPSILVSIQPTNSHVGMISIVHGWTAGVLHHLALTRQGTTLSLFLDGVWKQSVSNSNAWYQGGGFTIGNYSASAAYGWQGAVQELRVSDLCRYPGTTTFTPPSAPFTLD